jgi:hypothetical protein
MLARTEDGEIDPGVVITHCLSLSDAARGYERSRKQDDCMKVVLQPRETRWRRGIVALRVVGDIRFDGAHHFHAHASRTIAGQKCWCSVHV